LRTVNNSIGIYLPLSAVVVCELKLIKGIQ